jgi:ATPase subunit of ABC transporter with duplicated ATPase domains
MGGTMILLQNISKAYGRNTLLKDVSYHCPSQGRIALVGNNGAGRQRC